MVRGMKYYIRFSDKIKRIMIKHTFDDPSRECGGFLFGSIERDLENECVYCDVDGIYYEKRFGNDHEFNFGFTYIRNAYKAQQTLDKELIGTYHSHGRYPAVFSDIDRNNLQKFFGENKITIVYSPKYSHLVGEYMDEDGKSYKAKILTKNKSVK